MVGINLVIEGKYRANRLPESIVAGVVEEMVGHLKSYGFVEVDVKVEYTDKVSPVLIRSGLAHDSAG